MKRRLLLAKSWVMRCAACHKWYARFPQFMEMDGKGDQCPSCFNTSFSRTEGRPYGRQSKAWKWIADYFDECQRLFSERELSEIADMVITDPPLNRLPGENRSIPCPQVDE